jgi:hypothetical protein
MGYVIQPRNRPIKTQPPPYYYTLPSGTKVFVSEKNAQRILKEEQPIFRKMKKYELDRM